MNPKPSEILLGHTSVDGGIPTSRLYAVLDEHHTQHADLERRVAAIEAKPAPAGEGWPRWTCDGVYVYRYDSPESCFFCYHNGKWDKAIPTRDKNERDITHAEAVAICPAIAETYPLPTVKPVEPASEPAPASVEADVRVWAQRMFHAKFLNGKKACLAAGPDTNACCFYFEDGCGQDELRDYVWPAAVRWLTAFAARAVAREKARADAAEKRVAELEVKLQKWLLDETGLSSAYVRIRELVPGALDTGIRGPSGPQVWEHTEKCVAVLKANLSASESEARRLREDKAKLESKLSTVRDHLTQWNEATTNAAANMAMSNAFNEVMT